MFLCFNCIFSVLNFEFNISCSLFHTLLMFKQFESVETLFSYIDYNWYIVHANTRLWGQVVYLFVYSLGTTWSVFWH